MPEDLQLIYNYGKAGIDLEIILFKDQKIRR